MKEQEIRDLAKEKGIPSSHNKAIGKLVKELKAQDIPVELEEEIEVEKIAPVITKTKAMKRTKVSEPEKCEQMQSDGWEVVDIVPSNNGRIVTYTLEIEDEE